MHLFSLWFSIRRVFNKSTFSCAVFNWFFSPWIYLVLTLSLFSDKILSRSCWRAAMDFIRDLVLVACILFKALISVLLSPPLEDFSRAFSSRNAWSSSWVSLNFSLREVKSLQVEKFNVIDDNKSSYLPIYVPAAWFVSTHSTAPTSTTSTTSHWHRVSKTADDLRNEMKSGSGPWNKGFQLLSLNNIE